MSEDAHMAFQARKQGDFLGPGQPGRETSGQSEDMFMSWNSRHALAGWFCISRAWTDLIHSSELSARTQTATEVMSVSEGLQQWSPN